MVKLETEKTMRSLKKVDTPILKGMQIFHNYMCVHQGLEENKTLGEKAGMEVEGDKNGRSDSECL